MMQQQCLPPICVRIKISAHKKNIHEETLQADAWYKSTHAKRFSSNEQRTTYLKRGSPTLGFIRTNWPVSYSPGKVLTLASLTAFSLINLYPYGPKKLSLMT